MKNQLELQIDDRISTPKYKQIINSVIANIESGTISFGQQLPSINQVSFDYQLSRDTVEKAYNEMKARGILTSVKGKGYYVSNSSPQSTIKILVLFNKLSAYKKVIYNSLAHAFKGDVRLDFFIYHCNFQLFEQIISERTTGYNYYIIMPHFSDITPGKLTQLLKPIPKEKILILDHNIEGFDYYHGLIYQDFKMDIFNALEEALPRIQKYNRLHLVFPSRQDYPYPVDIVNGYRRFCSYHNLKPSIFSEINSGIQIEKGDAFVIIEESDLVNLIKICHDLKLRIGHEIGLLSYNETPLKEVLEDGISVVSTDFTTMGNLAANMILSNEWTTIKNNFQLILRNSL